MKKKKFAIIDPVGLKAGMDCYDLGLLNALDKKNIQCFSFSNFFDKNYISVNQSKVFLLNKTNKFVTLLAYVWGQLRTQIACRLKGVDVVLFHVFSSTIVEFFAFKLAKLFRKKIVAIIHDVDSLSNNDNYVYKKRIYNISDILIVHNQTSYDHLCTDLSIENQKKVKIIPHGNYLPFVNSEIETGIVPEAQFSQNYTYLLFFGQIKPVKGLDVLLRAMKLLPDNFKLIIAGRPQQDPFERYEMLIKELDIEKKIIPIIRFIANNERDYLFKKCDALVLPYRKIFQSGVLLMAMSYGLPVVASDLSANKEVIIARENGFLFSDGDYQDLAIQIEALFQNGQRYIVAKAAQTTMNGQYSWDKIAEKYMELIISL